MIIPIDITQTTGITVDKTIMYVFDDGLTSFLSSDIVKFVVLMTDNVESEVEVVIGCVVLEESVMISELEVYDVMAAKLVVST